MMAELHKQRREKEGRDNQQSYAIGDSQSAKRGPNAIHGDGIDAGNRIFAMRRR